MSPTLQSRLSQNDWSEGEVRDVAPALISPSGAYSMTNALLDEDGSPYRRGGSFYKSSNGLEGTGLRWGWDGYLLNGPRTIIATESEFGTLAADDKALTAIGGGGLDFPTQAAAMDDLLYIGSGGGTIWAGSRKAANYSTGSISVTNGSKTVTGSGVTWATLVDPGMMLQIGSERLYVVENFPTTSTMTLRDPYVGETKAGASYSLMPIYAVTSADPYVGAEFVTVCANRFVYGVGRQIFFTEVDNPHTTINSLGTSNEHTLPAGIKITGLETVGQTVLIFTSKGIWTLDGLALSIVDLNGNSQQRIQLLSTDMILETVSGIAGWGQRLVVPTMSGIYLMDGVSQPSPISKPIGRLYLQRLSEGFRPGQASVYRGHYFLPLLSSGGRAKETLVCRLDRPTSSRSQTVYPWSRLAGDGGETAAYFIRSLTLEHPRLFGGQSRSSSRIVDCTSFFEPSAARATDADGTVFDLDIVTRDYETGAGTINKVRSVRSRYELEAAGAEEPRLQISFSDTSNKIEGFKLGTSTLGTGELGSDLGTTFVLAGEAGPSNARDPARMAINKGARYLRLHIRTRGAAARCVLRSLSLSIRPSEATRR